MDNNLVVAKIRKTAASEIWVTVKEYEGKISCDVREYFQQGTTPDWLPTKKGVSIPPSLLWPAVGAAEDLAGRNALGEVAVLPRGERAQLRFAIREYNRHTYGDVRVYYRSTTESEEWKPGKGVTVPLPMLSQLVDALRLAEEHIHEV